MSATTQQTPNVPAVRSLADMRRAGVPQQTAKQAGGTTVQAFFMANKAAMAAMLPRHMDAERMVRIALRALRTTPKLMDCTMESLMAAVITCSNLGLEPNTPLGHVYLVPFNGRRKNQYDRWEDYTDVQVIMGYKGMVDLARRSGEILSISTHVVHQADTFDIEYGLEEKLIHKPNLTATEAGPVIGAYAVAKLKGGGTQFEFMTLAELHEIRNASQGYQAAVKFKNNKTPWIANEDEMFRKSPLRRLFKMLPISIEIASAMSLDDKLGLKDLSKVLEGVDYTEVAGSLEQDGGETQAGQEQDDTQTDADQTPKLAPPDALAQGDKPFIKPLGEGRPDELTVDRTTGEIIQVNSQAEPDTRTPEERALDEAREAEFRQMREKPARRGRAQQDDTGLPLDGGR